MTQTGLAHIVYAAAWVNTGMQRYVCAGTALLWVQFFRVHMPYFTHHLRQTGSHVGRHPSCPNCYNLQAHVHGR